MLYNFMVETVDPCFCLGEVQKFLEYVITLEYDQEPDYHYIKKLFKDGLKKHGAADDGRSVKFKRGGAVVTPGAANGRTDYDEEEEDFKEVVERAAGAIVKTSPQKVCIQEVEELGRDDDELIGEVVCNLV